MHSYIYLHCVDAILIGRNSATRRVWPPVARTVHTPNVLIQNSFNYPSSSRPFIRVLFFCLCSVFVLLFLRRVDPRIHFIYMSPLLYVGSVQIHPMQSIGVQLNNHLYIYRASMLLAEHTHTIIAQKLAPNFMFLLHPIYTVNGKHSVTIFTKFTEFSLNESIDSVREIFRLEFLMQYGHSTEQLTNTFIVVRCF